MQHPTWLSFDIVYAHNACSRYGYYGSVCQRRHLGDSRSCAVSSLLLSCSSTPHISSPVKLNTSQPSTQLGGVRLRNAPPQYWLPILSTVTMATSASSAPSTIRLPSWAPYWLIISALLMLMDCLFLLLRPHTFKGGRYHSYFTAYDTYTRYDPTYLNTTDAFINSQNLINLLELTLSLLSLPIYQLLSRPLAAYLIVLLSASECSKTLLFFVYSCYDTDTAVQYRLLDVSSWDIGYVSAYLLPSLCWIVFPVWLMVDIGGQFIAAVNGVGNGSSNNKGKKKQ